MHFQQFWKSNWTLWSRRGQIQPSRVRFKSGFVSYQVDKPSPGGPTSTWWKFFQPGRTQNPAWIQASRTGFDHPCFEVWRPGNPKTAFLGSKKAASVDNLPEWTGLWNGSEREVCQIQRWRITWTTWQASWCAQNDQCALWNSAVNTSSVAWSRWGWRFLCLSHFLCVVGGCRFCVFLILNNSTLGSGHIYTPHPPLMVDTAAVWSTCGLLHISIGLKPDRTSPQTSVNICLMTLIAETALEPDVAGLKLASNS